MAKKIGVVLSGCGLFDGSEIHEAVHIITAIDAIGGEVVCIAPENEQMHVIDHSKQATTNEKRNTLVESARIARGNIKGISNVKVNELDAIVFPGGFGAAKNLCDFAVKGVDCTINNDVMQLFRKVYADKKPIAAMCIAPVLLAKAFQNMGVQNVKLTIGRDKDTADKINQMNAIHMSCDATEVCIDRDHKVVTTPAYMLAKRISEVKTGAENLITELFNLL